MHAICSLFPKFYKHLDPGRLAALVREVGLDTVNVVVRDGYWVTRAGLAQELPAFCESLRAEGMDVHWATTPFSAAELVEDDTPLAVMADCGIRDFRMQYFPDDGGDVFAQRQAAAGEMARLVPVLENRGIRAVYQVHMHTLFPGPSAVAPMLRDLPPECVGVMLDPGNQAIEGGEDWSRGARLVRNHICALGVKDLFWWRDKDDLDGSTAGWTFRWCPLGEGINDWPAVVAALDEVGFDGTLVWMPFYDADEPALMTAGLSKGVAYLRGIMERS